MRVKFLTNVLCVVSSGDFNSDDEGEEAQGKAKRPRVRFEEPSGDALDVRSVEQISTRA